MDRPPEGMQPDNPSEADAPASGEDRSVWRHRIEAIEFDDSDPSRTLIFRRFDAERPQPARPHLEPVLPFDPELVPNQEPDCDQDATSEGLELVVDEPDLDADIPILQLQTEDLPEDGDSSPTERHRHQPRRSDPVRHGLVMLVTVLAMLATARFVLPGIVEEIRYAQHRGQLRAEFEVAGEGLKNVSLDTLSQAYQMVNAAAGPSVVHIDITRNAHENVSQTEAPGAPSILISDQGSGVVVDADGYILTNRHVVATSDEISVTLSDGRTVTAMVVGTDELTDLAVLKVNAKNLIPIPWGDSERIRVGSPVWAIGSPFGLDRTVTFGILSGKHRVVRAKDRYQDFMQSDVAVNPGNSGGPLVDSRGTLIGINTAIVGDTYQGVSFAIPSGIAKKIYLQLRETGSIERGWLGVHLGEVPNDMLTSDDHRIRGAMILALVDERSGAAKAGLQAGDMVIQLDGERIRDVDHLMLLIGNAMAGNRIKLSVIRDAEELQFEILLGRRPNNF